MDDIVWMTKHQQGIFDWYRKQRVFTHDPFASEEYRTHRESFIRNYFLYHAHLFTGSKPRCIWQELQLHDAEMADEKPIKSDILLQYEGELWIIEVKFGYYSPDLNSSPARPMYVIDCEYQLAAYKDRINELREMGWFPDIKTLYLGVFWAHMYMRERRKYLDTRSAIWLSKR